MLSPESDEYYLVIWTNGVSSVHDSVDSAQSHIARLREGPRAASWQKATVAIVWVTRKSTLMIAPHASQT